MKELADKALDCETEAEVQALVKEYTKQLLNLVKGLCYSQPFFVQKNFIKMAPKSRISGIFLTKLALKNMGENNIINTD